MRRWLTKRRKWCKSHPNRKEIKPCGGEIGLIRDCKTFKALDWFVQLSEHGGRAKFSKHKPNY
ncbi:MAG: hypothetical protein ACTS46_00555 [Candidatus Hodgkinia cicadicola]